MPGRVLGAIGYIHTVHHKHVDAFGGVDHKHKWASLVLDKLLKRSLIQFVSWKSWCGILRLDHLMEDFMRLPRSSAPRARFAMVLLMRVEAIRSIALVVQTCLQHFVVRSRGFQHVVVDGSTGWWNVACPIALGA